MLIIKSIGLWVAPLVVMVIRCFEHYLLPMLQATYRPTLWDLLCAGTYRIRLRIAENVQRVLLHWWDSVALWIEALRHSHRGWVIV